MKQIPEHETPEHSVQFFRNPEGSLIIEINCDEQNPVIRYNGKTLTLHHLNVDTPVFNSGTGRRGVSFSGQVQGGGSSNAVAPGSGKGGGYGGNGASSEFGTGGGSSSSSSGGGTCATGSGGSSNSGGGSGGGPHKALVDYNKPQGGTNPLLIDVPVDVGVVDHD